MNTAAPSDCRRCAAFFITHHPAFPYGCRAIGCRSRRLPCVDVLETSGQPCLMFTPKARVCPSGLLRKDGKISPGR
jgi:hypothetical protein